MVAVVQLGVKVVPRYLNWLQYAKKQSSLSMMSFVSSMIDCWYGWGVCMASVFKGLLVVLSPLWMESLKHLK
jgi:hypothetical protein